MTTVGALQRQRAIVQRTEAGQRHEDKGGGRRRDGDGLLLAVSRLQRVGGDKLEVLGRRC